VAGSELAIFDLDNLSGATNHNGGALNFGPDGKLYVAVGENANGANSQSMNTVLGKMLRINPDGTIPDDNPFFLSASGKNRAIWALGFRNPFTFAFKPFGTELFINDVGESTWEEINDGLAGANYGWPTTEGPTTNPAFKSPRYAYDHSGGTCAITGGAFYVPITNEFPSTYVNDYFFADFCGGWIHRLDLTNYTSTDFATGISAPVDLKVGPDGALYYLAQGSGFVYRVVFTGPRLPIAKIGAISANNWLLDTNGNFASDGAPTDFHHVWGSAGDIPRRSARQKRLPRAGCPPLGRRLRRCPARPRRS